jgi:hypothetical protein
MSTKLQTVIEAIQELSPLEQLQLIGVISRSLSRTYQQSAPATDFWGPQTLEERAETQGARPIEQIASLAADFWPEDESADDVIDYIYEQRREDPGDAQSRRFRGHRGA